ncbi:hypothetical protein [Pseudoxanthomonas spadix]|uniref:hypothetical protein n=1 Tax=Pseudoxanthomonas spadix TaxID=415229 RepID=UPI001EE64406|nr:hypothetical protein [Pseudoxanthomonas spadix]
MKPLPLGLRILVFMLTATGAVAAAAQAQMPSGQQLAERLAQADANGDGFLDRAEVADMPRLKRGFDKLDTDRDGRLSRAELQVVGQKLRQRQS